MVHLKHDRFGVDMVCMQCGQKLMRVKDDRAAFLNAWVVQEHEKVCSQRNSSNQQESNIEFQ